MNLFVWNISISDVVIKKQHTKEQSQKSVNFIKKLRVLKQKQTRKLLLQKCRIEYKKKEIRQNK